MGTGGSKGKKAAKASKKHSTSSSSSSSSSSSGKGYNKKLSIDGNNNRDELIDVVLEYVNTNQIKSVSLERAARLKATEINWQWAIVNGTSTYSAKTTKPKLEPTKCRRGWRNIRIYVSSTFEDFKEERDVLSKAVFTQLREWCEERKLRLVDVDLRWGAEKDLNNPSLALLALSEINRCYAENTLPFFLGLVGEKLGWIPDENEISSNIAAYYGWIYGFSLYEMEILHSAYRYCNPNALFMVRDPEYLVSCPDGSKKDFVAPSETQSIRTSRLKTELLNMFPNTQVPTYQVSSKMEEGAPLKVTGLSGEVTSFGTIVLEFFKKRIDELYPLDPTELDPVEETRQAHRNYVAYYAENSLPREEILVKIEDEIKQPTQPSPIVVQGGHGTGKTTILAQSARRTIDLCQNGGIPLPAEGMQWKVLLHFVGSAPGSTDLVSFLERLLKETGQLKPEVFDDLDMMTQRVRNVLAYGSTPIIVYIDAIDLIDEDQQKLVRRWLPPTLARNVRVILSTTTGTLSHKIIQKCLIQSTIVEMSSLEYSVRMDIFKSQLLKYSIKLDDEDCQFFLNLSGAENLLWLCLACQYIITNYSTTSMSDLKALPPDLNGLQGLLIGGLDSGSEHRLVMATLFLIYTSRRGLLERELRTLLCTYEKSQDTSFEFEVLPYRRWAVVYDRVQLYLKTNAAFGDGRLDFSHKSFSDTFEKKFLAGSPDEIKSRKKSWHTLLAVHFKNEDDLDRKAEELPYHLEQLDDVNGLADCLADWEIFDRLFSFDVSSDLIHYWQKAGGYDAAGERYKDELQKMEGKKADVEYSNLIEKVVNFDIQVGQYNVGIDLLRKLATLEESKLGSRPDQMADVYQLLACCKGEIIRSTKGDSNLLPMEKEVVDYCERSIELRKKCAGDEHKIKLGETYITMTNHLAKVADLEFVGKDTIRKEAEKAVDEAISIFEQMDDKGHKAEALMAKGGIYRNSDNDAEEKFTLAACDMCLQIYGEDHILSGELCKKVAIMYEENDKDLKNACVYYKRSLKIFDMLLGDDHPKTEQLTELLASEKFAAVTQELETAASEKVADGESAPAAKAEEPSLESAGQGSRGGSAASAPRPSSGGQGVANSDAPRAGSRGSVSGGVSGGGGGDSGGGGNSGGSGDSGGSGGSGGGGGDSGGDSSD